MVLTSTLLMHGFLWVVLSITVIGLYAQNITTYRLKSTDGLSEAMIFFLTIGLTHKVIYSHLRELPLSFKSVVPFQALLACVIAFQHIYFKQDKAEKRRVIILYTLSVLWLIGITWAALTSGEIWSYRIGTFSGWVTTISLMLYQFPQIYKNHKTKNMHGLSLYFVLYYLLGAIAMLTIALLLPLPTPTIWNEIRSVTASLIQMLQFYRYPRTSPDGNNYPPVQPLE